MTDSIAKEEFIGRIRKARRAWVRALTRIPATDLEDAGFCGGWSALEVVAHIRWYESEMVTVLERREFAGSDLWELPTDERNTAIHNQHIALSAEDELRMEEGTFSRLMTLMEALPERDLSDPRAFPGMPLEWKPWRVFASNTYEHYEDHLAQAEAFLAGMTGT